MLSHNESRTEVTMSSEFVGIREVERCVTLRKPITTTCWISLTLVLLALSSLSSAQELLLHDVPTYYWTHGCSPTAGMMVLGYWDSYGYGELIDGTNQWNDNKTIIQNSIASQGHISDYALYDGIDDYGWTSPYPDLSTTAPGTTHSDDCLADFMGTSRSSLNLTHGGTYPPDIVHWLTPNIANGMEEYAEHKGYNFSSNHDGWLWTPGWDTFVEEIQSGRPVVLNVDSDAGGVPDHSVTGIGCRIVDDQKQYAFRSTWELDGTEVRWAEFKDVTQGLPWGVDSMERIRPDGTRDTEWAPSLSSSGWWGDESNWDHGLPDDASFAYIPEDMTAIVDVDAAGYFVHNVGNIHMDGGTLTADQIRNPGTIIGNGAISGHVKNFGQLGAVLGDLTVSGDLTNCGRIFSRPGWELMLEGTMTADGGDAELTGGQVRISENEFIGRHSKGSFRHTDGTHIVDKTLHLGWSETSSGTYTLYDGALTVGDEIIGYEGDGYFTQYGGTHTITGDLQIAVEPGSYGRYTMAGGTLSVAGLTITGEGGQFELGGDSSFGVRGDNTFTNMGTFVHKGDSKVLMYGSYSSAWGSSPATISNHEGGTYDLSGDGDILLGTLQTGWGTQLARAEWSRIQNEGTFRKSAGTGESVIEGKFNNTGILVVDSGTLNLKGGGRFTNSSISVSDGATLRLESTIGLGEDNTFNGLGVIRIQDGGSLGLGADTTVRGGAQIVVDGGRLSGHGLDSIFAADTDVSFLAGSVGGGSGITTAGSFNWQGGSIGGTLFNTGSSFTITGEDEKSVGGDSVFSNYGTVRQEGDAAVSMSGYSSSAWGSSPATIRNREGGTYDLSGDGDILLGPTGWGTQLARAEWNRIQNEGTLRKSAGSGQSVIEGRFINSGLVDVRSGIMTFSSGYSQTAGATMLNGGTIASSTPMNIYGGSIGGTGTIEARILNHGGLVSPGFSPGMLTIDGDYTQGSEATLLLEMAGLGFGEYDIFNVTGTATLGGYLEIDFLNDFRPTLGDSFDFFNYGSCIGQFDSIFVRGFPQYGFIPTYGLYGLSLETSSVPDVVPLPSSLFLAALGLLTSLRCLDRQRKV